MTRLHAYIQYLRHRIESAFKDNGTAPLFSLETVLLVLSVVYKAVMSVRARLYDQGLLPSQSLPCRVVSIGNIIAGGTGKTPMTILVARIIRDLGYRVVVISRGYRGRMEASGGIVSDGRTILAGPEETGDEPYLMARVLTGIPVVVGRRRFEAGMLAIERFKPHVIVLDDAFQHLRLKRDLNLVLLDSRSPFGNGHVLPRGLLREPVSALLRANAVIFTRSINSIAPAITDRLPAGPVFRTVHIPVISMVDRASDSTYLNDAMDLSMLQGKKAVTFAGLADNGQFFDALERAGCLLEVKFAFADHHRYTPGDLDRIANQAVAHGADLLVTTAKDWVKIERLRRWPLPVVAVDVSIGWLGNPDRFRNFLATALEMPATRPKKS